MPNTHYRECPACNAPLPEPQCITTVVPTTSRDQVYVCPACDAVYGVVDLRASYDLVRPRWYERLDPPARTRYYDFTTRGPQGIGRRHGWYDPKSRLITQTG